jgi:hypothetical protein
MDLYTLPWVSTALVAATAKTMTQLGTPTGARARLIDFCVSFDGVTATAVPVTVEILLQTTAGTASTLTPAPVNAQQPAALCAGLQTFTAEPTASTVLYRWFTHPQGGQFLFQWPLGREPMIGTNSRIGLRVTAPAAVNCLGWLGYEE